MAGKKTSVYSMLNVAATLDGQVVRGFWDGDDTVAVAQGADVGSMMVGADGSSIFSQTADESASITFRLQHTSPTHRQLVEKWKQQRAGRLVGFPFDLKDRDSGEGGTADQCFIRSAPGVSKGKAAGPREWVLITGQWEPNTPD